MPVQTEPVDKRGRRIGKRAQKASIRGRRKKWTRKNGKTTDVLEILRAFPAEMQVSDTITVLEKLA